MKQPTPKLKNSKCYALIIEANLTEMLQTIKNDIDQDPSLKVIISVGAASNKADKELINFISDVLNQTNCTKMELIWSPIKDDITPIIEAVKNNKYLKKFVCSVESNLELQIAVAKCLIENMKDQNIKNFIEINNEFNIPHEKENDSKYNPYALQNLKSPSNLTVGSYLIRLNMFGLNNKLHIPFADKVIKCFATNFFEINLICKNLINTPFGIFPEEILTKIFNEGKVMLINSSRKNLPNILPANNNHTDDDSETDLIGADQTEDTCNY